MRACLRIHPEHVDAEIRLPCPATRSADAERHLAAAQHHRSAAEQIEYWAELGQQIADFVDPQSLLDVAAGLARLRVEPILAQPVASEAVFAAVESNRRSRVLPEKVTEAAIRYQASRTHPGYLEQIDAHGKHILGSFRQGVFVPRDEQAV
ncbi:MAG: hypothetical protein ACLFQI_07360 [Halochromatium sp.]|uniref:hypothetical protein n=1 Tax=Halochromatium sp. TaxID=2049430 RepID=UPI003978D12B